MHRRSKMHQVLAPPNTDIDSTAEQESYKPTQVPPAPIPMPPSEQAPPSPQHICQIHSHTHSNPHGPPQGPLTTPTPPQYHMVQMLLHQIQNQKQLIQITMSRQAQQKPVPPIEVPCIKLDLPKWETKVEFGAYRSCVKNIINNAFLSLVGNISTDPGWAKSSRSIVSFLYLQTASRPSPKKRPIQKRG